MKRTPIARPRALLAIPAMALLSITAAEHAVAQGGSAVPVRYTEARLHRVRRTVMLTGSVESRRTSVVAAEVEGVVDTQLAREGDRVAAGRPLVRLRRTNLQLRLEAVTGQLKEAQARLSLARTSLARTRGLFEEKIISQQQLDDAASEFEAWQGRVEQLQAEVARLEEDLSRATVRAPFGGIVVEELVAEGEWLAEGGAVVRLMDLEDLEVTVDVPEGSFAGLAAGYEARVVIPSLANHEVDGRVRAVVPRADPRARTFPVKIAIANPDRRIAVGMLAQVYLPVGQPVEALIVPKDAVVAEGAERVVYRIQGDATLERLPIRLGQAAGDWLVAEGELAAGDRLVTRGNERVFPGQRVEAQLLEYPLP